jgi:hypothetical protein
MMTKPYVGTCPLCELALNTLRVRSNASTVALKRLGVGADCLSILLKEKSVERFVEPLFGGDQERWRIRRVINR